MMAADQLLLSEGGPEPGVKIGGLDWALVVPIWRHVQHNICGVVTNCSLTEQDFSKESQCHSDGLQSVIKPPA